MRIPLGKVWASIMVSCFILSAQAVEVTANPCSVESPYFSPHGGVTNRLSGFLGKANVSIKLMAYRLTSPQIINSLIAAKNRGVDVQVILDSSEVIKYYGPLLQAGVTVYQDRTHAIQHNKFMVVDGAYLTTGSFNYSLAAENSNAENVLIISCRPVASKYVDNFNLHKNHSVLLN